MTVVKTDWSEMQGVSESRPRTEAGVGHLYELPENPS